MEKVGEDPCPEDDNATAVKTNDNIDELISSMNQAVQEYKDKYPDLDFCEWTTGKNGLPTLDLCNGSGMHAPVNGICTLCGNVDNTRHTHIFEDGVCICGEEETENEETTPTEGSILSEGNIWIVIAVAVLALGGAAALVIVKKKKKPALADGENTDEE